MPYTPERTKAAIFAAAVAEFAAHGLAGARVDRIAAVAGADKKAIYLYFGNKKALFEAVLATEHERMADAVPLVSGDIAGYVEALFDYQRRHPEYRRLMLWEALELPLDDIPEQAARAEFYQRRLEPLVRARRTGNLDDALQPPHLWLALVGMVMWTFAVPQLTRMVLGGSDAALGEHRRALADFARRITAETTPRPD